MGGGEAEAKRLREKKAHNQKKKALHHYCTARLIFNWWKDSATEISSKCTQRERLDVHDPATQKERHCTILGIH